MPKTKETPHVLIGDFPRVDLRRMIESGAAKVGLVPVAATEQHLHHLDMSTDCVMVESVTHAAARKIAPLVLIAPTVSVGVSEHHMKHPGSLTTRWEIFTEYIFDIVHSLARGGLKKIVVVNGHGGNVRPMAAVLPEFQKRLPGVLVRAISYWDLYDDDLPMKYMDSRQAPGHADEYETAALRYLDPARVHENLMEDPEAKLGTIEKGKALLPAIIDAMAAYLQALAAGNPPEVESKMWMDGKVHKGIMWHPFVASGTPLPGEVLHQAERPADGSGRDHFR